MELYEKFSNSDARGLVSFQAIVALFLHFGGEHYIAKNAMDKWHNNLLHETLSNQSEKYSLDFEKAIDIIDYLLRAFLSLQSEFDKNESMKKELIDITMDRAGEFDLDEPIQNQMTSTPSKSKKRPKLHESTISAAKRAKIDKTTDSIISKTNIDATKEAKSERKKDVFREILDPAPGLINNFYFTDEDLNKEQDVEKTVEIRNTVKNTLDDIFDKIEKKINPGVEKTSLTDDNIETTGEIRKFTKSLPIDLQADFKVNYDPEELSVLDSAIKPRKKRKRKPKSPSVKSLLKEELESDE